MPAVLLYAAFALAACFCKRFFLQGQMGFMRFFGALYGDGETGYGKDFVAIFCRAGRSQTRKAKMFQKGKGKAAWK